MSIMRRILNRWLRLVEKRRLRVASPKMIRRALEVQSRLFFYAPRGTKSRWVDHNTIPCLEIAPRSVQPGRVLLYFHGGGFVFGSPDTHSAMVAQLALRVGARAVMPKYRLAPEAACPAAFQDVRAAWDGLIAAGVAPADIVVGGDSAGGALAFGLIAALCAEGAAKPGAVFGFSPLTDMTYSGPSFIENADSDVLLPADRAVALAEMFLQGHPGDDPDVSPLFARFDGSPPAWITVGDTEILLDDARRLAAQMRSDGVQVQLVQEHDLPHVWPLFHNILPEARQTLNALGAWIRQQQGWES